MEGLDSDTVEIRNHIVLGLEKLFEKKSPRANLMALDSNTPDSKRKGLVRLFQRGLLNDEFARSGIREAIEDSDAGVRQMAFWVSVLGEPALASELRTKDKSIDRQLKEIESFSIELGDGKSKKKAGKK